MEEDPNALRGRNTGSVPSRVAQAISLLGGSVDAEVPSETSSG